jgi:hypothetical protein
MNCNDAVTGKASAQKKPRKNVNLKTNNSPKGISQIFSGIFGSFDEINNLDQFLTRELKLAIFLPLITKY